jgi:hypothetical protein
MADHVDLKRPQAVKMTCGEGLWCATCETGPRHAGADASTEAPRAMIRNALGRCDDYMGPDQKQTPISR